MSGRDSDLGGLRSGLDVGPYRLTTQLGAGGMGIVFGAIDTKLQRQVAIKFLSNRLADADGRRRFQREAQLASSLNHPHILTVHDAGEFQDDQYLVTELVDGGTLKEWAAAEKRTWRQIVDLLIGVADGLATAHQAGILHRDVKPQNVLVTKSGYAKLADFGLAKLSDGQANAAVAATAEQTRTGMIVGTVAYMSPEQASGRTLDVRSDVFSFGVMLYELLAGHRPFSGASELETLQGIMHGSPAPLAPGVPLPLRIIVEKALEKDPADRYQSMRELVVDLRRLSRRSSDDSGRESVAVAMAPPPSKRPLLLALSAIALIAVGAVIGRWFEGDLSRATGGATSSIPAAANSSPGIRFQRITDLIGNEEMPAVSPDGKAVAYIAPGAGRRQVWVRLLAGGPPVQVTRDDFDHEHPRWFPDSSTLAFFVPSFAEGKPGTLWQISAFGGTARRLAESDTACDISHDGRRIATIQRIADRSTLVILGPDGALIRQLAPLPIVNSNPTSPTPRWSPGDRALAYNWGTAIGFEIGLFVIESEGGEPRLLTRDTDLQGHTWLPDGSGLIYASATGANMRYPATTSLRTVSLDGVVHPPLTLGDVSYQHPDLVPGHGIVASRMVLQSEIWGFPVSGSPQANVQNATRITHQTGQVQTPTVSADGSEIAYLSDSGGHSNVWITKVDGSDNRQLTFERDPTVLVGAPVWSPVDPIIAFVRQDASGAAQWLVNADGSDSRRLEGAGLGATWSPDGRWVYSHDGEALCIQKTPLAGGASIRVRCGATPAVSRDATTIFFTPTIARQNEILKASPPDIGVAVPVAQYPLSRVPKSPQHFALSPDDRWLATPLKDGATTNIWLIPTAEGPFRQVTDFGTRPTLITRQVSWSRDGRFIYAAVIDQDADVVLLNGIVP